MLKSVKDKMNSIKGEASTENPLRKQRILENRLDKAVYKYNEAVAIKKTYELILSKLNEEKLNYDNQLEKLQDTIR